MFNHLTLPIMTKYICVNKLCSNSLQHVSKISQIKKTNSFLSRRRSGRTNDERSVFRLDVETVKVKSDPSNSRGCPGQDDISCGHRTQIHPLYTARCHEGAP